MQFCFNHVAATPQLHINTLSNKAICWVTTWGWEVDDTVTPTGNSTSLFSCDEVTFCLAVFCDKTNMSAQRYYIQAALYIVTDTHIYTLLH